MTGYTLYCGRKGYFTHMEPKQTYPFVSMNRDKARRFYSYEQADTFKKTNEYLHWFVIKEL